MLGKAWRVLPFLAVSIAAAADASAMSRPCGWITAEEMKAALRAPVTSVEDRKNFMTGQPNGCTYETDNLLKSAVIEAYERGSPGEAQQYFAQLTQQAARLPGGRTGPVTPVSGIGEEAANVANVLYVRKGALVFALTVFDGEQTTSPESFAKAKSLAQKALGRI